MNLAASRSARLKEKLVMRIGCILVSAAMVMSMMVTMAPRAKAAASAVASIPALVAGFLDSVGLTPVVTGMTGTNDVDEALARLIQDYLDDLGDVSIEDWLGPTDTLLTSHGRIFIPKAITEKIGQFAAWLVDKFSISVPGQTVIYNSVSSSVLLADGSKFRLSTGLDKENQRFLVGGSCFGLPTAPDYLTFATGYSIVFRPDYSASGAIYFYSPDRKLLLSINGLMNQLSFWPMYIGVDGNNVYILSSTLSSRTLFAVFSSAEFDIGAVTTAKKTLALDIHERWQDALDRITSLAEQQALALQLGIDQALAATMSLEELLQWILDRILAGELSVGAEIVDTTDIPEDPGNENPPDNTPYLPKGLDALGNALTTRFPFSIPWDVAKGVKLLAAPAKAPYFELNLLAPITHRVGHWKGSTKIVLDFSQYEVIGQVSRWATTIGFCLMLASGTKRLIWTA